MILNICTEVYLAQLEVVWLFGCYSDTCPTMEKIMSVPQYFYDVVQKFAKIELALKSEFRLKYDVQVARTMEETIRAIEELASFLLILLNLELFVVLLLIPEEKQFSSTAKRRSTW